MSLNRSAVSVAVASLVGGGALCIPVPASAILPDGDYRMVINETPYVAGRYNFGSDGNWNSGFSFGCKPGSKGCVSQAMTDNSNPANGNVGPFTVNGQTTGVSGNGAGAIEISVAGGVISVTDFQVDPIFSTAGGDFLQYADSLNGGSIDQMAGTVDSAGNMTFTPTGRLGTVGDFPALVDERWNVSNTDCSATNNTWITFTTGQSNSVIVDGVSERGRILGAPVRNIGDKNSDDLDDFGAILVLTSQVGCDWASFNNASYAERWNVTIFALPSAASADEAITFVNMPVSIPVLANDGGQAPRRLIAVTPPAKGLGTTAISGDVVIFTPNADVKGIDTFTYTMQENDGTQSTAVVTVIVTLSPAVAKPDIATTDQGAAATIDLTENDVTLAEEAVIDSATVSVGTNSSAGGTITNVGDGTVTYSPAPGFAGVDSFTYTVRDTAGNTSDPGTVTVTVNTAFQISSGTLTRKAIVFSDNLAIDNAVEQSCVGGCFDFAVAGAISPLSVIPTPLTVPIAENAVYRKLINDTWADFNTSTGDAVASAPLSAGGGCPVPNDGSWSTWNGAAATAAQAGHICLRLMLNDNGPNDTDPTLGVIADPSGAAAPIIPSTILPDIADNTNGGCSVADATVSPLERADWWLVGGFMAWLAARLRRKSAASTGR